MNKKITASNREYRKHRVDYVLILLLAGFLATTIMTGICGSLANYVLKVAGIPYITHTTITMLLKKPLALIALLVLLLVLVYSAYYQYSVTLVGMRRVKNGHFSLHSCFAEGFDVVKNTSKKGLPLLCFYIILLLPMAGMIFDDGNVFSKVQLPIFIVEFMFSKWYYAVIMILFVALVIYLGLKFLYVLPLVILKRLPTLEAFKESSRLTKGKKWKLLWTVVIITLRCALFGGAILLVLVLIQKMADIFLPNYANIVVIALLSFSYIFKILFPIRISVVSLYSLCPLDFFDEDEEVEKKEFGSKVKLTKVQMVKYRRILTSVLLVAALFVGIQESYTYIFKIITFNPYVISHRGVDGENGVQNTIPAMKATIESAAPDFIEMDIHETKDGKFVMMHDENLYNLCGVDARPIDMTLEELQKLKATENGHTANLDSFDDYLKYADENDQKLLIEIKTTADDSPDMLKRFFDTYGKDIIEHGHRIHSMNYTAMEEVCGSDLIGRERAPMTCEGQKYFVGIIIPFNLLYPITNADAYTMEETTINSAMIESAYDEGKEIYAWTVNDRDNMEDMIMLGVDGLITDNPSLANETILDLKTQGYASIIYRKFLGTN